ncbi:MFS transporter [Streptomyces sp. NPDC059850]|uniref:MFS transporter n=1 Tax=Streptomyces sp. NPDC059850 TaxID=3346970 RepID=UPI0036648108
MSDQVSRAAPQARRALFAGGAGNFVEWFDFALYGFLATVIADEFFPGESRSAALLSTFGIFAVTFFVRPLGAVYFGRMGDRLGRRHTLTIVVLVMSGSTALIGVLPTYDSIGVFAPLLLLILRLVQGFSAGGEYSGASAFILESAPADRRGRYASVLAISTNAASLAAVALVAVLTTVLGNTAMGEWGWRLPFLLSLPLGLCGLYLRLRAAESPVFTALAEDNEVESAPLGKTLRTQRRPIAIIFAIVSLSSIAFYVLKTYWPTYLSEETGLPRNEALWSSAVCFIVTIALSPFFGSMSDRFGRRAIVLYSAAAMAVLAIPSFLLSGAGGFGPALAGQLLFVAAVGPLSPTVAVLLVEMFPANLRYTASSIGYNLAYMVFGGTAPYLATLLISQTGSRLAPAYYIVGVAAIALVIVALTLRETAPRATPPREAVLSDSWNATV